MSTTPSLMDKFKAAPASTRTGIIGAVVVVAVLTVGTIMTGTQQSNTPAARVVEKNNIVSNNTRAQTNEDLAGEIALAQKSIRDQQAKIDLMAEQEKARAAAEPTDVGNLKEVDTLIAQVQLLQDRLASLESGSPSHRPAAGSTAPGSDGMTGKDGELVLGPDGKPIVPAASGASGGPSGGASSRPQNGDIQVVTAERKAPAEAKGKKQLPNAYLAAGSNFEAILLNGMDASTAIGGDKSPTPALLRVKSDAILANMQSYDVKECFILVGGSGSMSTERVALRTETMSCYSENGQVWEGKVEGYVVGEDGKAGARGRLVSKQGSLLAKTFAAGFIGGLGSAFQPQAAQSLNLNTGGQVSENYQYPSANKVLGSSVSKGLSDSAGKLAAFYLQLSEQMFPILELDSGRKVTIVLLKGVELKLEKRI